MRHKRSTKRVKRASATQLYRTCKAAGTCPPDIIPKVEGNTVADQILKYGSMAVFFGGLGIGSGSGTGGRSGYVPLGTTPPTAATNIPIRPPVTVESIPLDTIGPLDSSIVSLVEETSFIESGAPVVTPRVPPTTGFTITTSTDTTPAILDVTSISTHDNPTFTDPSVLHPPTPAETSGHFVLSSSSISTHNYEEIPMDTFIVSTDSNNITNSTPIPGSRPTTRLGLYSKGTQQVKVVDPAFMTSPAKLITYDNPAYEGLNPDTTLQFEHEDISLAPDPDFMDIIALHRPALTSRKGTIRYSRVGNKRTMHTRSGKAIGARVHYYQDLSSITEDIELQPLQHVPSSLPHTTVSTSLNDGMFDIYAPIDTEDDIIFSASSNNTLYTTSNTAYVPSNTTIPLSSGYDIPITAGPDIVFNSNTITNTVLPVPTGPIYSIIADGGDFYLHPSYYLLKRRRKRIPYFFADVSVAV
uniref:Minor capsid protein L2 n=1 Tax=Human papillomavirus 35 TaxID=10587 RepID=A0A6M3S5S8_HPV35|nr:L2 [human papillomavirus 35]